MQFTLTNNMNVFHIFTSTFFLIFVNLTGENLISPDTGVWGQGEVKRREPKNLNFRELEL